MAFLPKGNKSGFFFFFEDRGNCWPRFVGCPKMVRRRKKWLMPFLFLFLLWFSPLPPGGSKIGDTKKRNWKGNRIWQKTSFLKRKLLLKHKRDGSEKTFITDQKATTPDPVFFDAPFLAPFNVEQITHCSIIVEATTFREAALAPISPFFITFFDLISFSLHSKGARATRKGLPTWGSTIIFAKRATTILFTSTFVNTKNLRKANSL